MLGSGRSRIFQVNAEALGYLSGLPLSKNALQTLRNWPAEQAFDEAAFIIRLDEKLPKLAIQHRKAIIVACWMFFSRLFGSFTVDCASIVNNSHWF